MLLTLFHHKRRKFAELVDYRREFFDGVVDLLFGIVPAQAEAD